jgi:predicted transcriptional regulator
MEPRNIISKLKDSKNLVLSLIVIIMLMKAGSALAFPGETNEYIISGSTVPGDYIDSSGTDGPKSYDEVPLWIKASVLAGVVASLLCQLKYIPFILGKVKKKISNGNRRKLLETISENPGCTVTEIINLTRMNVGTIRYHLYILEKKRDVVSVKTWHTYCYFLNRSRYTHEQMVIIALSKNKTTKRIIHVINERPGISNKTVSGIIGIDKSSVHWHIKRLAEADVIMIKREGKTSQFFMKNPSQSDTIS